MQNPIFYLYFLHHISSGVITYVNLRLATKNIFWKIIQRFILKKPTKQTAFCKKSKSL